MPYGKGIFITEYAFSVKGKSCAIEEKNVGWQDTVTTCDEFLDAGAICKQDDRSDLLYCRRLAKQVIDSTLHLETCSELLTTSRMSSRTTYVQ